MSPTRPPGAPNATRGLVIVVVAALLGVFLLARGGSNDMTANKVNKATSVTTTTVAGVPSIPAGPTTIAPSASSDPAAVKVGIFNGTSGKTRNDTAAGDAKRKVTPLGYTNVTISDTAATAKSAVYFAEGFGGDAASIAKTLGLPATTVKPIAGAKGLPSGTDGLSVVVILGQDAPPAAK